MTTEAEHEFAKRIRQEQAKTTDVSDDGPLSRMAQVARDAVAATTGPYRLAHPGSPLTRQRSPDELSHLFGKQAPAAVVKFTTKCMFAPNCEDTVNGHATDPDACRAAAGSWRRAPEQGWCIADIPLRVFRRVHNYFQDSIHRYIDGARLIVIEPSDTPPRRSGTLWILGVPESTSIDQLCADIGVVGAITALPAGIAGEWACGPAHLGYALQRATVGMRVVTTTTSGPEAPRRRGPIELACTTCGNRAATLSGDPRRRAQEIQSQGAIQRAGRIFCGSTCEMLAGPQRSAEPLPPLPPRSELKQKYAGWPESNAERVWHEAHPGQNPDGTSAASPPEPTAPAATDPPSRPKTKGR